MGNIRISIITVCYNASNELPVTIESVINQPYSNLEYIIVDGGSSDNSIEVIKKYEKTALDNGITFKWISEADQGISHAFNKGIKMSSGEIIGLINAGDFYLNGIFSVLASNIPFK